MQAPRKFFHLSIIYFCLGATIGSEVHYTIRSSQSQSCDDQNSSATCLENGVTLSHFVNNLSDYLTNDTILFFSSGNYNLESNLTVEDVHSFSMLALPIFSSKAVITCNHNARFEFRNVSTVTVSGLEFVKCFEINVISVGHFQLENSRFFGNGQSTVNCPMLTVLNSIAYLDRVHVKSLSPIPNNGNNHSMVGILSRSSSIEISQSWFEGNNVGLGAVIYDEFGSNIKIVNTTFVNNNASTVTDDNITSTGGIVYTRSLVKVYDSKFIQNSGVLVFGVSCNVFITHTAFVNNSNNTNFTHTGDLSPTSIIGYPLLITTNETIINIDHSEFINNTGLILYATDSDVSISHSEFAYNNEIIITSCGIIGTNIEFIDNSGSVIEQHFAKYTSMSISYSEFVGNNGGALIHIRHGTVVSIDHSRFISNSEAWNILFVFNTSVVSLVRNDFIDNALTHFSPSFYDELWIALIVLDAVDVTLRMSEFTNNMARNQALVEIPYHTTAKGITNNAFTDNNAVYNILIRSDCRPGLSLSLGSNRCIQCSKNWIGNLIGIVILNLIAGVVFVILMLVLNMTVAIGTLNGILFYANIVAANADTYFFPFTTPNFITVFMSWINLEIGFDICIFEGTDYLTKGAIQFVFFPIYIVLLVIAVIVASERSSKFAKMISKLGNPAAVLATMILFSHAKLSTLLITYFSIVYGYPAYGSNEVNYDNTMITDIFTRLTSDQRSSAVLAVLLLIMIPIFLLYIIFTALIFSWQWLLRYQDKAIFKWVRYQKLRHLLEPYHAPYTAEHRYWTGLLLLVRILLYLISFINFSLDPRVELMAIIFTVGGIILLKGVIAKRVYKNWPLDVMETAIYFNLVAFSALTWYNLDLGGNQAAVAYTSVMIIFILLMAVIVFHVLRYTRLYKWLHVEKAFKWTTSILLEKKPNDQPLHDSPEELDGYQLERSTPGELSTITVTHSVVELNQSARNQESGIL